MHFNDVEEEAADAFVGVFGANLAKGMPRMRHIGLYSDSLGENGGYALGRALKDVRAARDSPAPQASKAQSPRLLALALVPASHARSAL